MFSISSVELVPLSSLKPYERNPRDNDKAVGAVAKSIQEYGFLVPIVISSDGTIICGHTRWKAAAKLKMDRVPVVRADHLSEDQMKAFRLADNRLNELAEWDETALAEELAELSKAGYNLDIVGFDPKDLGRLMRKRKSVPEIDESQIPEPPDEPVTKPGDLWILGNHRLLCSDAGDLQSVMKLTDGNQCHLLHTDPPYNSRTLPRTRNALIAALSGVTEAHRSIAAGVAKLHAERVRSKTTEKLRPMDMPIIGDNVTNAEHIERMEQWLRNAGAVLQAGSACYVWAALRLDDGLTLPIANIFKRSGFVYSTMIIWYKQGPTVGFVDYQHDYEPLHYGWKEGATHRFYGDGGQTDVWCCKKPSKRVHATQKPIELALRTITNSTMPGERVLDLFGGSGTTLIACEMSDRSCCMMEISPHYCDVIVQRWEQTTGAKGICKHVK